MHTLTHTDKDTKGMSAQSAGGPLGYECVPTAEFTVHEPGPTSALSNDMLIK